MLRKHRRDGNGFMKKSIVSLAGVLGVLFLCLGVAGYHNWVNAENTKPVVTRCDRSAGTDPGEQADGI